MSTTPQPKKRRSGQIDDFTNLILAVGIVGTAWICTIGSIALYFSGKSVPGEFTAVTGAVYGTLGTAYYGARRQGSQEQDNTPKPEET